MAHRLFGLLAVLISLAGCVSTTPQASLDDTKSCTAMLAGGFRKVAEDRAERFNGKVGEDVARCRGGARAVAQRATPFVDWANYWATGDMASLLPGTTGVGSHLGANGRGVDGALLDLEYQRMELIKFNLFDNAGSFADYALGRHGVPGTALKTWTSMRLGPDSPFYAAVGGEGAQRCQGELIRWRQLDGLCNDILNPRMGSAGMPFARNVQFEATYPDTSADPLARNRHGDRLSLLQPDPQRISRVLFTRAQSDPARCRDGQGLPGNAVEANCDYQKAPFFNVLAAFWIQFMTHDWFSHLDEGRNDDAAARWMRVGCDGDAARLGCRPEDRIDTALVAQADAPPRYTAADGSARLARAPRTHANTNTAWWDASQIYGYSPASRQRVQRDPADPARLLLLPGTRAGAGEAQGQLPVFRPGDPILPQWAGQGAAAFPDNWSIGVGFYHTVFSREHNAFVAEFRRRAAATPDADSGLRDPANPAAVIRYRDVSAEVLFEVARLVVAAEIAKIHTIEWTTQLLYDEPLYLGMNANWGGLFDGHPIVENALEAVVVQNFGKSTDAKKAGQWYSALASGPGIFGLGARVYQDDRLFARHDAKKDDIWNLANPEHVNGGVNHFGSPFNFPEEFVSVYRLHALVPDLIELRHWDADPNRIAAKVPVVETFRAKATGALAGEGAADWALSMGRQRLGLLTLGNTPAFLQNLAIPRLRSATGKIDVAALDILRDREHGVPRFNEFRRQYGLRQLTRFDDFIDARLPADSPERARQQRVIADLRSIYGQHRCDASKVITAAQKNADGSPINDCLGQPDGSLVDNIEDVDTVVGWLAEFTRPHGYAISETQFQVFILNASRRLFSDRFFTSSFRPEFYGHLGVEWLMNNGPTGKRYETRESNGHRVEVSPFKRVLLRTMPELAPELAGVVNAFDPWARDRGEYYGLGWKPRKGAEADPAFR